MIGREMRRSRERAGKGGLARRAPLPHPAGLPPLRHGALPPLRRLAPASILLLAACSLQAQPAGQIVVGPDVILSEADAKDALTEPYLARNPARPDHLVAVAIVSGPLEGGPPRRRVEVGAAVEPRLGRTCAAFSSLDGGITWSRHDFALAGCVDPWVEVLPDSTAVFAALVDGALVVHRSPDGGRTWEGEPVMLGGGHDHPTLLSDAARGRLYAVSGRGRAAGEGGSRWSVFLARSSDGGRTFPFRVHETPFDLLFEPQNPVVLRDGRLIVPVSAHATADGREMTTRSWVIRSSDGGATFSPPSLVAEGCFGPGGWPSLAVAPPSSEWADRLFFVCVDREYGGVLVYRSGDEGRSWEGPVRPERPAPEPHVAVPALAVAPDGVVAVAWYDRGDDPSAACQHIRVALSVDGGRTFLPDRRVTSAPSCPAADPRNRRVASRWPHGGDYSGLVATGPGRFRILWADARDGVYRLRTAEVTLSR